VDLPRLLAYDRYSDHDAEGIDEMLGAAYTLAGDVFHPLNQLGDQVHPHYDREKDEVVHAEGQVDAMRQYAESGFHGLVFDYDNGGLQLPLHVASLMRVPFTAANVGLAGSYMDLSQGVANMILAHANQDLIDRYIPGLVDGSSYGCMCLSETGAGSSLTDLTCKAEPTEEDGTYKLSGNKVNIRCAHGCAHGRDGKCTIHTASQKSAV
jgi:butyryl-CoA dehydrogenase